MDGGIYPMTFAYMALGRPAEVKAVGSLNDDGIDLNVAMAWRYDSGAVAALTCGLRSQNPWTAVGERPGGQSVASAPLPPPRVLRAQYGVRCGSGSTYRTHGLGYHYEAAEVMRALRNGLVEVPALPACRDARDSRTARRDPEPDRGRYPGDDDDLGG